jgi:NTE family protein
MGTTSSSCNIEHDLEQHKLQEEICRQNNIITRQEHLIELFRTMKTTDKKLDPELDNKFESVKKNRDYEYLVFSGGSVKGITYCGCLDIIEQEGILYDKNDKLKIKGFAGTSVGSVVASLLAIGYTNQELKNIMMKLDTSLLYDEKSGFIRDSLNFIEDYGVASGNFLYNFIGELIKKKTGDPDYTIDQLYNDKGITLVAVGTDMNTKSSLYFYPNHKNKNCRDISIRKAIRISTSIPFIFKPVTFDNNLCVDGGILDYYPLHVFDGDYPGQIEARLNIIPPNTKVLGINIMTEDSINSIIERKREDISCITEYALSFITTFMTENRRKILTTPYRKRTINIITLDIPTGQFSLTMEQKQILIEQGKEATMQFFE